MRIIQRYILKDLLANFIGTTAVLSTLMIMVMFSIRAMQTSTANLAVSALLTLVGYSIANRADILIALATLTAVVWTYGRAKDDGEITAMRGSGISLRAIIAPALLIGGVMSCVLGYLQDSIIPACHYRQIVIGKQHLADDLSALLLDEKKEIRDKRFKVIWSKTSRDADGYIVLENIVVSESSDPNSAPRVTRARYAKPTVSPSSGELTLELEGFTRGNQIASEKLLVPLDLRAISEEAPSQRKLEDLSYEELLSQAARTTGRNYRKCIAEFHRRATSSFAPLLFALLGAPFGIIFRMSNRVVVFATAFLIVILFYFGPVLVGIELAVRGVLPAWISLWFGQLLILGGALWAFGRARRG